DAVCGASPRRCPRCIRCRGHDWALPQRRPIPRVGNGPGFHANTPARFCRIRSTVFPHPPHP
ncbi:hypothetical protein ABTF51_20040, partial [Acinetobacter baumannii]